MLDPELAVVGEPAVERLGVGLGPVEEIAIPDRRGLDRVVGRGVEQEGVAAGALEPARGRAAGSSGSSAQAIRTEANPPGASAAGVARTTCSETASPRMPPSRNRYALSGETTYGGFATTRSNCSPSTGSKKLPSRVSTLPAPLSAALNAA